VTSYVLVLRCCEYFQVRVGALGVIAFRRGYYYYVGSANSGVHRVKRHFSIKKKKRWHIDYISAKMEVVGAILSKEPECGLAQRFESFERIRGFGCSDCDCESHLFYSPTLNLEFLST
jgi:Uri superfamily endonuclease